MEQGTYRTAVDSRWFSPRAIAEVAISISYMTLKERERESITARK